jgi:hypothetical protein
MACHAYRSHLVGALPRAAKRQQATNSRKKITALPAVFKEFATPVEVISWQKAPLCIGAIQGLSPINELLYLFQW